MYRQNTINHKHNKMTTQEEIRTSKNEQVLTEYFDNFVGQLRVDEVSLKAGVASKEKVEKYKILSQGTPEEIARYNVLSNSLELIKRLIIDYMNAINEFEVVPIKLAFDWSLNKLRVWVEIKEDDEKAEEALILAEAKANAKNKDTGFYIISTIVEDSDNMTAPPHYASVK